MARQYLDDEMLWRGTTNQVAVYPREIIKHCLSRNAARIILIHNHPSDNVEPSAKDMKLTVLINRACYDMQISLDDHIILGRTGYYSFREHGIWDLIEREK